MGLCSEHGKVAGPLLMAVPDQTVAGRITRLDRGKGRAQQQHGRSSCCSRENALTRGFIYAVSVNGLVCKHLSAVSQ